MRRAAALLYGAFGYLLFLASFLYLVGFLGNRYTPSTIDSGVQIPTLEALRVNLLLLLLFAAQHSLMARPWFKRRWTRIFPAPVERTTYLLATCFVLLLTFRFWEPMPDLLWRVQTPLLRSLLDALYLSGWALVMISSAAISHADLFGLRQVWLFARRKPCPPVPFQTPGPYRYTRHPMMLGLILALWSASEMSEGRLLFAAFHTLYILVALRWEERDLVEQHGDSYRNYRRSVSMLLPLSGRK